MSRKIAAPIRENARLFLKRAIKELISVKHSQEAALSEEQAIMAVSMTQSCFELALVALFIERDGLISIVKKSDAACTEEELQKKFEANALSTQNFNVLKDRLVETHGLLNNEEDEAYIDSFQRMRNKVMHLAFHFEEEDRFDLQFEIIYFITRVIIPILDKEEHNPAQILQRLLDASDFKKLVAYPAYRSQANQLALDWSGVAVRCMECDCESLGVDGGDSICYACCTSYHGAKFIDCLACEAKYSIIYDNLNIESQVQRTIDGRCLRCDISALIYACPTCGHHVWLGEEDHEITCFPSHCALFTED